MFLSFHTLCPTTFPNITLTDFAIDFHRLTSLQIKVVWTLIQCVSSNFAKTCCHQSFHQEKNITTKHHQHSPSINSLMTTTLMTTTLLLAYYDKQRGYRDPWSVFAKKMQAPPIEKKIGRNNDIYINEKKKRIKVDIFSKSLGTSASNTVKCAIPWNSVVF